MSKVVSCVCISFCPYVGGPQSPLTTPSCVSAFVYGTALKLCAYMYAPHIPTVLPSLSPPHPPPPAHPVVSQECSWGAVVDMCCNH